jgi:excisionase family DNA binding protein
VSAQPRDHRPARLPQLESAPVAARLLGIGASTLYRLAAEHRVPHYRIAGAVRFDVAELVAWARSEQGTLLPNGRPREGTPAHPAPPEHAAGPTPWTPSLPDGARGPFGGHDTG